MVPKFFEEITSEFGISKKIIYENEFEIFSVLDFDLNKYDGFFEIYHKLKNSIKLDKEKGLL
jgi:hypothetical protein